MPAPVFQEWLNLNSYRNYPFREDASLVPAGESGWSVPNYLLVDFILTTAGDAAVSVRLHNLAYVGGFLTLVFVDAAGDAVTTLAVNTRDHVAYAAYPLVGAGQYEDARGSAVLGDLRQLTHDMPEGAYVFEDAALEQCTVRPDLRGVRSLKVGDGDNLSDFIRGHVKLIEGTNIRLTYLPEVNGIRVDAIDGAGFNQECDCEAQQAPSNTCISSINGISLADVQIVGDGECVEVSVQGNKIIIRDKCSSPCCGCPELEFITTNLALEETVLRRVEAYAVELQSRFLNTLTAILASTKGG